MKAMKNSPVYQGMEKAREIQELRTKEGEGTQATHIRYSIKTLNDVMDYEIPAKSFPSPTTSAFWKRPLHALLNIIKTYMVTPVRLLNYTRKHKLPAVKRKEYSAIILDLYIRLNECRTSGNVRDIEDIVGGLFYQEIQKELQKRTINPQLEYKWKSENLQMKVLARRIINVPNPKANFMQVVCRFTSTQKVDVISKATKEVVGGAEPRSVTEYYGFEKDLDVADEANWIIVKQLRQAE